MKTQSYIFNRICPCEVRKNGFAISGMFYQLFETSKNDFNQFSLN